MHIIRPISRIPEGFDAFIDELSAEYGVIYGDSAAQHYRSNVVRALDAVLERNGSKGFAAYEGRTLAGVCIGSCSGDRAQLDFLHLPQAFQGKGIEQDLLQHAVESLDAQTPEWFSIEFLPLCRLDMDGVLQRLGFRRINRALMAKGIDPSIAATSLTTSTADSVSDDTAQVLHSAFVADGTSLMNPAFGSVDDVQQLLRKFAAGEFGPFRSEWVRVARVGGAVAGAILGTAQTLDTGFVFQVAVEPIHQQTGLGSALMRDLESEFRAVGMRRVMLGVTTDTPAFAWYESQGYEILRPVNAYIRRRGGIQK